MRFILVIAVLALSLLFGCAMKPGYGIWDPNATKSNTTMQLFPESCEADYDCFLSAMKNDCKSATYIARAPADGMTYDMNIQKLRGSNYCDLQVVARNSHGERRFSYSYGILQPAHECSAHWNDNYGISTSCGCIDLHYSFSGNFKKCP